MSNVKILAVLAAAALALPVTAMSADQPITRSESVEVKATVVSVDLTTRDVVLKGPEGKTFQVQAGDAVQHLDQVKPGDMVAITYTESVAFQVVARNEKPMGESATAERVPGGGQVGRTLTGSFKIDAYDSTTHVLWFTTGQGVTQSITVKDSNAQAKLAKLIPGDVVQVTYSESLAVKLEKVAK